MFRSVEFPCVVKDVEVGIIFYCHGVISRVDGAPDSPAPAVEREVTQHLNRGHRLVRLNDVTTRRSRRTTLPTQSLLHLKAALWQRCS